jgi:cytoskeleton protein RodZ
MATTLASLKLEETRKRKGVSLQQIAEHTKIGTFFLRAIESEEFEKLPGGIFDTNYIRQYAAAIEIEPQHVLQQYQAYQRARTEDESRRQPVAARSGWGLRWLHSLFGLAHSTRG